MNWQERLKARSMAEKVISRQGCMTMEFNANELLEILNDLSEYDLILEKIKRHGCCVMHNDDSCPGCLAREALIKIRGYE